MSWLPIILAALAWYGAWRLICLALPDELEDIRWDEYRVDHALYPRRRSVHAELRPR